MPRRVPKMPRPAAELAEMPLHVVIRDYPETLAVCRRLGVDVPARGGRPVAEASDDAASLIDAIEETIAWRTMR